MTTTQQQLFYTSKHRETITQVSSLAWMTCDMSSPHSFPDNLVSPLPGSWKFRFDLANLANKARSLVLVTRGKNISLLALVFYTVNTRRYLVSTSPMIHKTHLLTSDSIASICPSIDVVSLSFVLKFKNCHPSNPCLRFDTSSFRLA